MRKSHGMSGSRIYNVWTRMKQRCSNPKDRNFKWYGAKGVTVCQEWANSFESFQEWALKNGYSDDLTIDRIESSGDYEPDNCRWITREANTSRATKGKTIPKPYREVEYMGRKQSLKEWSEELGIPYVTLNKRLYTFNYPVEEAFTMERYGKRKPKGELFTFNGKSQTLKEWSAELGLGVETLRQRLKKLNMPVEEAFTKDLQQH